MSKKDHKLKLDGEAIERARKDLNDGAVTPALEGKADAIVQLLNDSLATELVCVMRYRRHYFTAKGLNSIAIANEFLVHANEEFAHADKLAERIMQLGGKPDYNPQSLLSRSHATYDESEDIHDMIRANLEAERVAVEVYRQSIGLIRGSDPTTARVLEDILIQEEEHADELADLLDK